MPTHISSSTLPQAHNLSIYEDFAGRETAQDDDVVFKINKASSTSLVSTATKTISQRLYRFFFGQKKSDIVQDFSAALIAKYGHEVASFAFSEDQKNQALNTGLSKRMIKQIIKNASFARQAKDDIKAYVDMADMHIQIVQETHPEIEISELCTKFAKVHNFATLPLNKFKDPDMLRLALEEAIEVATTSKEILEEHVLIDSTWIDVPDTPITEETFQASVNATRLQNQKVMSELTARFQNTPNILEAQLAKLATAVVQVIERAAPELMVFANHVHDDPLNYFRLNADGNMIIVHPADFTNPASQLTAEEPEEHQKVWRLFSCTLEACYGKPLVERMIPNEKRQELFSSPLTVGHVKQFFHEIQHALEVDLEFLKNQPFILTDEYCDALLTHPELFQKALQAEQKAVTDGTLSIQIARKLFDVGVLTAGYHAGGLLATGIATTATAMTGVAVPIIPLTLMASTLCSWTAGRIVGSRTSKEVGSFAAYRAAFYTIGETGTEIVSKPFIDSLRDHLTHYLMNVTFGSTSADVIAFLSEFALEEGGSILADNLRHACIGSIVNGIDVGNLSALPNELHPTQAADMDCRILDLLKIMTKAVDQLSPPVSHQEVLKRTRIHL